MFNSYVGNGMIVNKIHEILSFKHSKWLEKFISFNTQKSKKAKNDFEKDSYILLNNAFYGKTMKIVRHRLSLEFIKNYEYNKITKQQSKISFNGVHEPHQRL